MRAAPAPTRLELLGLGLIIVAALAFTAATHHVFSATQDEPLHISAGLEWLDGDYRLSDATPNARPSPARVAIVVDPPLSRVAGAVGPYFSFGLRSQWRGEHGWSPTSTAGPRDLLYRGAGAEANLASARRGILPFLALAIGLTWVLGRQLFGPAAGIAAAAALACVPAVLGHAGLAATDVAFASMFLLTTLAFLAWIDRPIAATDAAPAWPRTVALGLALGLGLSTKLSTLMLLPGALVVAFLRERELEGLRDDKRPRWRSLVAIVEPWRHLAAIAGLAAVVLWAAYRFSWGRPSAAAGPELYTSLLGRCFAPGVARDLGRRAFEAAAARTRPLRGHARAVRPERRRRRHLLLARPDQPARLPAVLPRRARRQDRPLPFLARSRPSASPPPSARAKSRNGARSRRS